MIARKGSKGVPDKHLIKVAGKRVIEWTLEHALSSRLLTDVVLSTDDERLFDLVDGVRVEKIRRPPIYCMDTSPVTGALVHAVESMRARTGSAHEIVVLIYGNFAVRKRGIIDEAIRHLIDSGGTSVRSYCPVNQALPQFQWRLRGDRPEKFMMERSHRRQDFPMLYRSDGGVAAVWTRVLLKCRRGGTISPYFLGPDPRAILCEPFENVEIDYPVDVKLSEALLA